MLTLKKKPNLAIGHTKHLLQNLIKKGKKHTIETTFKKGLINFVKQSSSQNFKETVNNAFNNTMPFIGVQTKRKGSKNIYLPFKLTVKRRKFLATKWLLTNAFAKKKRKVFEGIFEELIESSLKKSASIKKREELHKLAEESLVNLKRRS